MWLPAPIGFSGIVQQPADRGHGTPKARPRCARADAYGGVLVDAQARVLLREPAGHFGGYAFTFAKGRPDPGEQPWQTALREVREETGYQARIIAVLPGTFSGTTGTTAMYVMEPVGDAGPFDNETASTRWASLDEARVLVLQNGPQCRDRDLAIIAAVEQYLRHFA